MVAYRFYLYGQKISATAFTKATYWRALSGGKMTFDFRKTIRTLMLLINIAILVAVFYYIWIHVYNSALPIPFFRRGNYILYLIYAAILTAFIVLMKGHSIGTMRISEIILSQAIAILLCNVVAYFQVSLLSYKLVPLVGFLVMSALQLTLMLSWALVANRIYFKIYAPQKMLLIYDDAQKVGIASKLNAIHERYHVSHFVNISSEKHKISTMIDACESVVLAVNDLTMQDWLIHLCYKKGKRLYFVPNITNVITNGAEGIHAVDTPLLLSRNGRLTNEERIYKRTLDIVCSFLGIVVLSPFMLLTAMAIWLYDRKNIFYFQQRFTRDAKVFKLYKFRSMKMDAEKNGACLATAGDSRITPVGRVIRKLRIDEIPQLFNVLKGDMSLVGPRPERPEIAKEYEKTLPDFNYRLHVKAGLTGYAQVYGNYDTTAQDKLLMDLMYIENYSFLLDLNLIFQTLRVVLSPHKAEGVRNATRVITDEKSVISEH